MTVHPLNWSQLSARRALIIALAIVIVLILLGAHKRAQAQVRTRSAADNNTDLHMEMSPVRPAVAGDSARAASVAALLRESLAQYRDTTAAVRDGYKMFMPEVKNQKTYHFTNNWRAVQEAFRFDPAKPTSILYKKEADGQFTIIGAMYTAPKRWGPERLDERIPLSIARWHKHVNWCLPPKGTTQRWLERKDGRAVFGPESAIATKSACDAVGGRFEENVFGWMIHANVFAGDDPASIWADDHMAHDMHAGMKMDGAM